jgi:type II secretory pathway component PulM
MGTGEALIAFWAERSRRERAVLAGACVLVLVVTLYALLWEPGLEARKRLSATLPRLRAQVEDMRLQKKEVEVLRKTVSASSQGADLRALLRASVERSLLKSAVERIEWRTNDRVLVAASTLDFDQWLDWVRALQSELGVRLDSCEISALAQPGRVRVEAVFASGAGRGP